MVKGIATVLILAATTMPACAAPSQAWLVAHRAVPIAPSVQKALEAQILTLEKRINGKIGVSIRLLETGESAAVNDDVRYPMASTYKVAIAGTVLARVDRGEVTLDQMIPVTQRDFDQTGQVADRLVHPGTILSVANLMELMLTQSNNTATDKMLALAGGPAAVTAWLRSSGIQDVRVDRSVNDVLDAFYGISEGSAFVKTFMAQGLTDAQIEAVALAPKPAFEADPRDTARPTAMVDLLARLFGSSLLKDSSRAFLIGVMERCETGKDRLKGILPEGTIVAHKTGTLGGSVNDVGMITLPEGRGHLLIAVYTKQSGLPEPVREHAIAEIGRNTFDYFTMR